MKSVNSNVNVTSIQTECVAQVVRCGEHTMQQKLLVCNVTEIAM